MADPVIPPGTEVVVLGDYENALAPELSARLPSSVSITEYDDAEKNNDVLAQRLAKANVAVVIRERTPLSGELLRALTGLDLVVTTGSNTSVIDLSAGVPVCATRSSAAAPAELTWALILACARNVTEESANVSSGQWQQSVGMGLEGKRLGILGLGRIGQRVARVALAFGMEVVAWSRNLTAETAREHGVQLLPKEELLATSDVISLHLRLGEQSREIIDSAALRIMQSHAILINTARAGLIQQASVIAALQEGGIGGFGQDVFLQEPLPLDSPLQGLPNTVLTPHLGYMTDTNLKTFADGVAEDIEGFYAGSPVRPLN